MKKPAKKKPARVKDTRAELFDQIVKRLPDDWAGRKELADLAGVSDVMLYNWERGVTINPRLNSIIKVAEALELDVTLVERRTRHTQPKLRVVK